MSYIPNIAKVMKVSWFSMFLLASLLINIIWNLTLFPCIMSPDSDAQMEQLISGTYNDWHPYVHTLFYLGFFLKIFGDPYFVAIFQQLWCSILFSWMFSYFIHKRVSKFLVVPLFIIYLFSYPIGAYNMVIWKDIPFTYSIVTMCFWLFYMHFEEKKWSKKHYLVYTLLLISVCYLRHNGIPYIIIIPGLIYLAFSNILLNKYRLILISLGIYAVFTLLLPRQLEITPKPSWYKSVNVYHISAGLMVNQPRTKLSKKTKQLLKSVLPKEVIHKKFDPTIWHKLHIENPELNNSIFNSKTFWKELNHEFYSKNLINNLPYIIGLKLHQFCYVTMGYGFTYYPSKAKLKYSGIPNSWYGKMLKPLHKTLFKIFSDTNNKINTTKLSKLLIWNSLLPVFIIMFCLIYSIAIRSSILFSTLSIIAVQIPILILFGVSNDWRYSFLFYLAIFIIVPMTILITKTTSIKYDKFPDAPVLAGKSS